MISLKNISYSFGQKVVLQDLNLEVQPGSIHSLIGLTGAGKTLILKLLAKLAPLQKGTIQNSGKKTAFVFQQNAFLPWLSMAENLKLATGKDAAYLTERLKAFRLSDYINLYPSQLSGGTIQKFNLLRAFITEADLILLDEPFSHLDIVQKEDLYHFMLNLWNKQRPTIILVTHDIDEAMMLSHSVSFLSRKKHSIIGEVRVRNSEAREELSIINFREQGDFKKHYAFAYDFLKDDLK